MGLRSVVNLAKNNLGWVLGHRDALSDARRIEGEAAEGFRREGNVRLEGGSRNYLAALLLMAGELAGAEREARNAVRLLETSGPLYPYALATLARVLLARGELDAALAHATLAEGSIERGGGVEEGEAIIRLTHAECLAAAGHAERASAAIAAAGDRLLERAARIADPRWRESFLRNIPEHARTLEMAEMAGVTARVS
jgi:hypothetical protein